MARGPTIEQYQEKLAIDPDNLLDDLLQHAKLCWEIGEQAELAAAQRDAAELVVDQLNAELDGDVRKKLAKGDGKVTEAMVKSAIKDHPRMAEAQNEYLEAKVAAGLWGKLDKSFHTRSGMLRLVTAITLRQLMLDEDMEQISRGAGALRSNQGEIATRRQQAKYANERPAKRRKE